MICNDSVVDDIHAYGVMGMQDYVMLLHCVEKYDIIHAKR